jgi:hypothetical protein
MDYIMMKGDEKTFVSGNLFWVRIECNLIKEARDARSILTRKWLAAATYLLDCRSDLAITFPIIIEDYDQGYIDLKANIVKNTGGNDTVYSRNKADNPVDAPIVEGCGDVTN